MRGIIVSRDGLCACLLVYAALVKISNKQAFVRRVCKNFNRRGRHNRPSSVHGAQQFSVTIHVVGNLPQLLQLLSKIFTLNPSLITIQKFGGSQHSLLPGCVLLP